ncbi:hypothetical protein CDV36_013767 [Fusarium kuroshium]|uniref:Xylose isomerase-like TIM barrel domain-containing protein n=1 Tax=Fusarium kuroshium TaxID=2010991 RepID=A0A3M2RMX3_9HYPO|nr:hypothetical protein CDV36_013767 [Fusarium kuroshium]
MVVIKRFRTVWGIDSGEKFDKWIPWFPELKKQGYAGVEVDITDRDADNLGQLRKILDDADLEVTVLMHTAWAGYVGARPTGLTPDVHLEIYRKTLELAKILRPVKINAQSGGDYWTVDESVYFYQKTLEVDKELGLAGLVCHETHRNRALFTPYAAKQILLKVPELRITADISHWVVVCERLLDLGEEDKEILDLLVPRVHHIHARIGTTQSSQCPEPEDPIFKPEREFFEKLWLRIVKARSQDALITFVPEYGPFPYHPHGSIRTHGQVADSEGARLQKLFEDSLKA